MSTNIDSRGVQRGDCSLCSCDQYNGGTEGKKCVDCGHPPGKHRNTLTGSIAVPTASSISFATVSQSRMLNPSEDSMDVDSSVCKFPGCSHVTGFDLNTGIQDDFCSDHCGANDGGLLLSSPPQAKSQPSPPQSFFSFPFPFKRKPVNSSTAKRVRAATVGPSVSRLPSALSVAAPPAPLVPLDQQCKLNGCNRNKFTEPSGYTHDFCGRRHAKEYEKQNCQVAPELQCKTPGCYKQRYQNPNGGYFDYCSLYCRNNGGQSSDESMLTSASTPNMTLTSYGTCLLPGCSRPKYYDPANGRVHDFCGRGHAHQGRLKGIAGGDTVNIRVATSQEKLTIIGKFTRAWASRKGQCPTVAHVFVITNAKLTQRWSTYRSSLQKKDVEEYYHGTKLTCNITVNTVLCNDQHCGLCGISNTGFDRRCIQKNISFQRFGHGFYLAPNSSKCHDYTQGSHSYRAMLLFDVCPGNKYNLKKGNESLKGPPQGFDSVYGQTGAHLNYEELVIYNPDAALPKHIIVYQKDGEGKIAQ